METYKNTGYTINVERESHADPPDRVTIRRNREIISTLRRCQDFLVTEEMILITLENHKHVLVYDGLVSQFYLVDPRLATWPEISPLIPRKILAEPKCTVKKRTKC